MSFNVTIIGSWGKIVADRTTGRIIDNDGYPGIERFDPTTLTDANLDILECGYWDTTGRYEPPEPDFMARLQ